MATENNKKYSYILLTINPNAECYSTFSETLKELEKDNPNLEYAYITHNADEDCKTTHIHVVIYSKGSLKRFNTWKDLFKGSHIETTNQQRYKRALQYLIHKNDPQKEQYKLSEVTTNIKELAMSEIMASNGYDFELFNPNLIYQYLDEFKENNQTCSLENIVKRFGLEAIKSYYFIIKDIMTNYNYDSYSTFRRHNSQSKDPVTILWQKLYNNLKIDFRLAINENLIPRTTMFEDYAREEYIQFIGDIEKGYYKKELEEIEKEMIKDII